MELEFELKIRDITKYFIRYDIYRKGLKVGDMELQEPYNDERMKSKEMKMK